MWQLSDAWNRRREPNVVLVHHDDLSADLEGQMRRLAALLEMTVADDSRPQLVQAATFAIAGPARSRSCRVRPAGGNV